MVQGVSCHKILVAEDDYLVRDVTSRILRMSGYDVVSVENGHCALQAVAKQDFRVIITDVMMPIMDGLEFLRILRNVIGNTVPVIVMSGSGKDLLDSLSYPNLKALTKPYEINDLLDTVASFLARQPRKA